MGGGPDDRMHSSNQSFESKERKLVSILEDCASVVIGYSGGVDSVYLAKAALDALGPERVLAVTGLSPSYPNVQRRVALEVADSLGLPHLEIETHELDSPDYTANNPNRCFFCKMELYAHLARVARERGYRTLIDGANADDVSDHRPGMAAARRHGVRSPLEEAGLRKAEIRVLSRRAGLPTWEAPASPCLASRVAYGIEVTAERLRQVEEAEERLRPLAPWGALRVRHHGEWARLEVAPADVDRFRDAGLRRRAAEALRAAGFEKACLDLEGYRRGALNEVVAGASAIALVTPGAGAGAGAGAGEAEDAVLEGRASLVREHRRRGYRFVALELYQRCEPSSPST